MVISVISLLWMGSFCRLQLPRCSPVIASCQREGCEGICLGDVSIARSLRVAGAKPDLSGNEVGCRKPKRVDILLLEPAVAIGDIGTCQQDRNSGRSPPISTGAGQPARRNSLTRKLNDFAIILCARRLAEAELGCDPERRHVLGADDAAHCLSRKTRCRPADQGC